jgi:hypothetical protein
VMNRKISITENGRTRRVSTLEGMMHWLRSAALRGDKAALKMLLPLLERYAEPAEGVARLEDLLAEDLEILARYARTDEHAPETRRPDEAIEPKPPLEGESEVAP